MKNIVKDVVGGFYSLVTGMRITIQQFFKPTVTLRYPYETLKMSPRFRGHIELVRDPATGRATCYACKLCERACPSDCITVDGVKLEGEKKKSVSEYRLDFTKCSLCGSCVEACKSGSIRFSREYNLASVNKDEFVMDLFRRLEAEAQAAEKLPVAPELATLQKPVVSGSEPPKPEPAKPEPAQPEPPKLEAAKLETQ